MDTSSLISKIFKIGVILLMTGYLGRSTYRYALKAAHEEQFGLISLGKFSRSLESGETAVAVVKKKRTKNYKADNQLKSRGF